MITLKLFELGHSLEYIYAQNIPSNVVAPKGNENEPNWNNLNVTDDETK